MVQVGEPTTEDDFLIDISLPMRTLHLLASEAPNTCFVSKLIKVAHTLQ